MASFSLGKSHVMQLMKTVRFVCLRISGKALRKPALQKPSTGSPGWTGVHDDAQGNHLVVKRLPVVIPGRDEMDFHAHFAPDNDLVMKFRSRSSVEAREPVDE